jgi:hypothetical protein
MTNEMEIQKFLKYLKNNGNLERLTTNLDNKKSPIHRWFPFLVGFSNLLVKETISYFRKKRKDYLVFDPFMGSGTTGVVGREIGVNVFGNEINPFLYKICKVKTSLHIADEAITLKVTGKEVLRARAYKNWFLQHNKSKQIGKVIKVWPKKNTIAVECLNNYFIRQDDYLCIVKFLKGMDFTMIIDRVKKDNLRDYETSEVISKGKKVTIKLASDKKCDPHTKGALVFVILNDCDFPFMTTAALWRAFGLFSRIYNVKRELYVSS